MGRIRRNDPDSSIGFLISDVARLLRRVYDRRVEPLGLTRAQWRVLVHLHRREGVSQTALAQFLEIEKPTLGRLVERLEEKGWIERRVDDRDQRARRLVLADAARQMIDEMEALAEAVHEEALAGLGADGERRLRRALLTVKANLAGEIANGIASGNDGQEDGDAD